VSLPRFYVDAALQAGGMVDLPAAVSHHAGVLRLRDGAPVVVFNGRGGEYRARLAARATRCELLEHDPIERESPVAVALVQAWIAADKLDWVVEKAVELGVERVALWPAQRSVVQLDAARLAKRVARLREIVVAACSQCGRNRLPALDAFGDLAAAVQGASAGSTAVVLHPDASQSLVQIARTGASRFAVAVGPEGGFNESELAMAERSGACRVHLGPRVLRTESAGLAAVSTLQAVAGDFR
jgi:16S rRNA (uracil1498-N3)-methyltransferase